MSSDTRERVDRHGEERARAAVLEMTRAMLDEVGYQRLRVDAVAARAGVPRVWLRRWWTTRPLLVAEALQRMDNPPDIVPTGDVRADVRAVVHRTAAFLADPVVADALTGLIADAARDPVAAERLAALLAARRALDSAVLLSATARGDLREDTNVTLLLDLVFGTLMVRLHRGEPPTPDVVDALVDLMLRGQAAATEPADEQLADPEVQNGAPLDGQPPNGYLLENSLLDGQLPRVSLDGQQPGGYTPENPPVDGHRLPRVPLDGQEPDGYTLENLPPDGQRLPRVPVPQQARDGQHARHPDGQPEQDGAVPAWSQLPERHRYP